MPAVVELILPRLVPIRSPFLRGEATTGAARACPAATLDLLYTILSEDPASWPLWMDGALQVLAQAPETASDSRLSELRRRIDLP
jgi:hypothetical protein